MVETKTGHKLVTYSELSESLQKLAREKMGTDDEGRLNAKYYTRAGQPYIDITRMPLSQLK